MTVDFVKYQALGNDYLVVDAARSGLAGGPAVARLLCDRHYGIGADGVLFAPAGGGEGVPVHAGAPIPVRTFNADGSVCGRSVNGVRMLALYLAEQAGGTEFVVRTPAGDTPVTIRDAAAGLVEVRLPPPSFEAADLPVAGRSGSVAELTLQVGGEQLTFCCLANGNPHAVLLGAPVDADRVRRLGPLVAGHPAFPQRVNVAFGTVLDRELIELRIFERGAGYTLASGSSSCAVAAAARLRGLIGDRVVVRMPGGEVVVGFDAEQRLSLAGVVEKVASGTFAGALHNRLVAAEQAERAAPTERQERVPA
ncbi:MAG TPA: diaminopimelate epimerase [Jatrophihabitans sp.]|nr:diaminopimelate epimerase [Jatrophihabitans sp.]